MRDNFGGRRFPQIFLLTQKNALSLASPILVALHIAPIEFQGRRGIICSLPHRHRRRAVNVPSRQTSNDFPPASYVENGKHVSEIQQIPHGFQ
jgi:hypothetical protein